MKKYFYIFSWIILGLLLSMVAHALIEVQYIGYLLSQGISPVDYTFFGNWYCALPTTWQLALLAFGLGGGWFAGIYFWRVIYAEKRYKKLIR